MATMQRTAMSSTSMPYSTSAAPSSSLTKFRRAADKRFMGVLLEVSRGTIRLRRTTTTLPIIRSAGSRTQTIKRQLWLRERRVNGIEALADFLADRLNGHDAQHGDQQHQHSILDECGTFLVSSEVTHNGDKPLHQNLRRRT